MRSILRATGMLSASTAVTVSAGLASAKVWAILVGTSGVGYMGLLQSLLGMVSLVVGLGVSAGLVRFGSQAIADDDATALAGIVRAAWLITGVAGCATLFLLVLLREPVSQLALGSAQYQASVPLVGTALVLGMVSGVQMSILNAHHKVAALAKYAALAAALGTAVELPFIWIWKAQGIPYAMVATAVVSVGISSILLRVELPRARVQPDRTALRPFVLQFLRFGGPYTLSMIAGAGVLLAMPILVLHVVGAASVGAYRAAAVIGVTYLGFLLAAMAQDYFPRVSAAATRPAELMGLINDQQKLVLLIGMPLILGALALSPFLVPLLYSPSFAPASSVLQWQLVGDVFRLSSWTLSFVILARCRSKTFFLTEVIGGATTLVAGLVAMARFGIAGAGMGYLVGYVVYYLVVWGVLRGDIGFRLTASNVTLVAASIAAVTFVRILSLVAGPSAVLLPTLAMAAGFGVYGIRTILRETVGGSPLVRAAASSG